MADLLGYGETEKGVLVSSASRVVATFGILA